MTTVDQVLELYLRLRDEKKALVAEHKETLKPLDEKIERCTGWLAKKMHADGTTSLPVKGVGTAYQTTRVSTSVTDWGVFLAWVQNNEQWEMLPHAANKSVVQEYAADNEELPPGVKLSSMTTVNVRR